MDGIVTRFGEIDAETLTEAKMEGRCENKLGTVRPVICSIERKFDHGESRSARESDQAIDAREVSVRYCVRRLGGKNATALIAISHCRREALNRRMERQIVNRRSRVRGRNGLCVLDDG